MAYLIAILFLVNKLVDVVKEFTDVLLLAKALMATMKGHKFTPENDFNNIVVINFGSHPLGLECICDDA